MKKIMGYGLLTVFVLIFSFSLPVQAGDSILIAAASNLRFAMHEICRIFRKRIHLFRQRCHTVLQATFMHR